MTQVSNDYKNGFNSAIEEAIRLVNQLSTQEYGAHISIYAVLLDVKSFLLKRSYGDTK